MSASQKEKKQRRVTSEIVRNLSVEARRKIVLKVIEIAGSKSKAAKLLGVPRSAITAYIKDKCQPGDRTILKLLSQEVLTSEEFADILLEDLEKYVVLVARHVGWGRVKCKLKNILDAQAAKT